MPGKTTAKKGLKGGERVLRGVHPNAGIGAEYKGKLQALIDEMAASYRHWLVARYRDNPPRMAMDVALPAKDMERELGKLGKQWQKRFDDAAPRLARWFSEAASRRSAETLRLILKDAGISVSFQATPPMRDAFQATVAENVGLIRSISQRYHGEVQGMVMRSVAAGRDVGALVRELEDRFDVTRKRAALIARDQNNKATAVMTRARQQQVGITKAVWLHSQGGKEPRRTHLANTGKVYDPAEGWFDPDPRVRRRIWPGELINCRCVSRPVVKGFS